MVISALKNLTHLAILCIPKRLQFLVSDETFLRSRFRYKSGREMNLQNPKTFNEKIQWIKLHDRNSLMTQCADKYAVREVIEKKVGTHILNELYGVFEDPNEIDFDSLPESFVLKATSGSGWNMIVKDKSGFDREKAMKEMKKWISTNYYVKRREWAYKNILPRIICEKYMEDKDGSLPDYKFFCFNGVPRFIQVDLDRYTEHKRAFYDTKWQRVDFSLQYPIYEREIEPPNSLGGMLEIASKLSSEFLFVRVDMYDFNGKPIFGELSFYPEAGFGKFSPDCWDAKFGTFLKLPFELSA